MNSEDMLNQRGARLQEIVKQCATVVAEGNQLSRFFFYETRQYVDGIKVLFDVMDHNPI